MAGHSAKEQPEDRVATANYVATLSGDLATLARNHGMGTLGYLLDMARLEAENVVRHNNGEVNPAS